METRVRWLLGSAALVAVGAWIAVELPSRVERTETDSPVVPPPAPAPTTSPPPIPELPPRNDAPPPPPAPQTPARQLYIPRPTNREEVIALAVRAAAEGEHGTESENARQIAAEFRALGPGAVDFLAGWLFTDGRKRTGMDGAWLLSTITTPATGEPIALMLHEGPSSRRALALRWLSRPPQRNWNRRASAAEIAAGLAACLSDPDEETRELAMASLRDADPRHTAGIATQLVPFAARDSRAKGYPATRTLQALAPSSPDAAARALEGLERCAPDELDTWRRVIGTVLPARGWTLESVEAVIDRIMRGTDRDKQRTLLLAFTFRTADVRAIRHHAERILREGKPIHDEGFLAIARAAIQR